MMNKKDTIVDISIQFPWEIWSETNFLEKDYLSGVGNNGMKKQSFLLGCGRKSSLVLVFLLQAREKLKRREDSDLLVDDFRESQMFPVTERSNISGYSLKNWIFYVFGLWYEISESDCGERGWW